MARDPRIRLFSAIVHWYLAVFQVMMENTLKHQNKETQPTHKSVPIENEKSCCSEAKLSFLTPYFIHVVIPLDPFGAGILPMVQFERLISLLVSWLP